MASFASNCFLNVVVDTYGKFWAPGLEKLTIIVDLIWGGACNHKSLHYIVGSYHISLQKL